MTVDELLSLVRYQINDVDKVEYTDNELIAYLNEALRFLSAELINVNSSILLKEADLSLTNGHTVLPSDFVKEEAVLDTSGKILKSVPAQATVDSTSYKIVGDTIYSENDAITLIYYAPYPSVSASTDPVPGKDYMTNFLTEVVAFLALNRNEFNTSIEQALSERFGTQVLRIANSVGISNYERSIPWQL